MLRECQMALRSLAVRRALSAAIVLTLAVSVGATTAVFSVLDAVVLKPLPYPEPDRLVAIFETSARQPQATSLVAAIRIAEWNRMTDSFEGIAGCYFENLTDTTGPVPERLAAMRTSPAFFTVLGAGAALGRTFTSEEERFGGPGAIVLSDSLWRSRFGADRSVVGRSLIVGGNARTIVGVMPASFRYPSAVTEAWLPAQAPPALFNARQATFYVGIGRMKPGVSLERARQDISNAQLLLGRQFPATDSERGVSVTPLKDDQVRDVGRSLWLLFAAVVIVLLASCGNIAGLLLSDASRRDLQVAVQFALGAPRAAVVRQRLLEGALLSLAGSSGGLLLANGGIQAIRTLATRLPRSSELQIDLRAIGFTIAVGAIATIGFALLPALQATGRHAILRLAGRGQVGGHGRFQRALVATQIAFAVILLVGASLLARDFARLREQPPGFDPINVVAFRMSASWSEPREAVASRQRRTLEHLAALPGVASAALTSALPSGPDANYPAEFTIDGRPHEDGQFAVSRAVSADYFRTLRMPPLSGEVCQDDPDVDAPPKMLVNQTFANRFFPGENPIGHRVLQRFPADIVGVVPDAREHSLLKDFQPVAYFCGLLPFNPDPWYVVRTDRPGTPDVNAIRQAMHEIEPQRAVYNSRVLSEVVEESFSAPRLNRMLFAFFAGTALLLVAVGLYSLAAQFVADRTREIGLRLALGAQPSQILAQVAWQSAGVTAAGVIAGLAMALALARSLASVMYGFSPYDPLTFTLVPLTLGAVAVAVTLRPARRATKLDPLVALHRD
jgi:putative ABC transport system permease protein